MTVLGHRLEVRGWYVALVVLWAVAGAPFVWVLGFGFGGLLPFLLWVALNGMLFAPIMLAPYGIRRLHADPLQ